MALLSCPFGSKHGAFENSLIDFYGKCVSFENGLHLVSTKTIVEEFGCFRASVRTVFGVLAPAPEQFWVYLRQRQNSFGCTRASVRTVLVALAPKQEQFWVYSRQRQNSFWCTRASARTVSGVLAPASEQSCIQ